jgi:chromosome transmission fidelity protein 4
MVCSCQRVRMTSTDDATRTDTGNSELEVKVVNTSDMQRVLYLRDQLRPVKSVSFDHSGALLAVSCTDGVIYVYSLSSEEPQLVKRVDGLISLLDSESEASAKVAWHPDGRAFGAPNALNGMWRDCLVTT